MRNHEDFGLDDWPTGGVSRSHAIHVAYIRAVRRAGRPVDEYVTVAEVARRDRWTCGACGEPVPQRWSAAETERAPVLAFTVPLAKGGRYVKANMRLTHLSCTSFADRVLARDLRLSLTGVPSTKVKASGTDTHCVNGHELAGANLLRAGDGRRRCRQCRNDRERVPA
jgi:hypothetical protein